jgi:preprotein translocase subunit SecD
MDRGWYARFALLSVLAVFAWFTLWPSLDAWVPAPALVKHVFKSKISPGLDIRGGLRLMYEVEVDEAVRDRRNTRSEQLFARIGEKLGIVPKGESLTREQRAKIRKKVKVEPEGERGIRITFKKAADADKLDRETIKWFGDLRERSRKGGSVVVEVRSEGLENIRDTAIDQARETISNRIDALGLRETTVIAQDTDIIVEVPGTDQSAFERIRDIISQTARLEFKIVDDESDFIAELDKLSEGIEQQVEYVSAGEKKPRVDSTFLVARGDRARQKLAAYVESLQESGAIPEGHDIKLGVLSAADDQNPGEQGEEAWRTYYLFSPVDVTGQHIEETYVANDPKDGTPYVGVTFNDLGARRFSKLTGANVKRRMAIVLDDRVESAPVIQTEIGKNCQITLGGYRGYNQILNEAKDLVVVLKAGALPVPIRPANEQMIGPTLGHDAIRKGALGALVGVALVLSFMVFYYQVAGLVANAMVVMNLLLLLGTMAFFEATLTLPGLAALALTMGMAVDANVLITERIREELRADKSLRAAVDQGFGRALWAILDSQVTTFLAGVVLFQYGSGPIKGFAVMLMIGICTSVFTAVFGSRVLFDWIVRGLRVERLQMG